MSKLFCTLVLLVGVLQALAAQERQGSAIPIEDYNSIAQVEVRLGVLWTQQCIGSIITNYHIVSTATCFYGALYYPDNRRLRIGSDQRLTGGKINYVRYAHLPDSFGQRGRDSDISVVQLQEQIIFPTPTVNSVTIIAAGYNVPTSVPVQIYGWGTTLSTNDDLYYDLKTRGLVVQNHQQCAEQYANLPVDEDAEVEDDRRYVTENMICLGSSPNSGLAFDSRDYGAPIIYSNLLSGMVAFGHNSGEYPVVATSISSFTPWIAKVAQILT